MGTSLAGKPLSGGSIQDSEVARFGIVTVSDRASAGVYEDASGPAILGFFHDAISTRWVPEHMGGPNRAPSPKGPWSDC